MTDLVVSLRNSAELYAAAGYPIVAANLRKAADEIERLRTAEDAAWNAALEAAARVSAGRPNARDQMWNEGFRSGVDAAFAAILALRRETNGPPYIRADGSPESRRAMAEALGLVGKDGEAREWSPMLTIKYDVAEGGFAVNLLSVPGFPGDVTRLANSAAVIRKGETQ